MANNIEFDDEDEDIFSEEDISDDLPSKGNRPIPSWLMGDFISWLDLYHPELRMVWNLPQQELARLIGEFEYFANQRYDYAVQEWKHSFQRSYK